MKRLIAPVIMVLLVACQSPAQERVIVAAGTTLVDSGLLDAVAEVFEESHPNISLSVVGEASARVLELGRRGGADMLITHAPDLEAQFVGDGLAARYELILSSSFVLVGPPEEALSGAMAEVLSEIAARRSSFVSRADGSGTHEVEQHLWAEIGIDPVGESWYSETGQGMGLTLLVADQRDAFTLSELGAFLTVSETLSLEPLDVRDPPANPYHLIVVEASEQRSAADEFLNWLLGPEGTAAVEQANRDLFGQIVYAPPD